ncbi:MAG: ATP-binding protein [Hyphomicrobiales bacterium]
MPEPKSPLHDQRQYDRRTWGILGLAILVLLAFSATVPSLYVALVRSGFLGDHLPPQGGWILVVGLVGLTALFSLYMIYQQSQINRYREKMVQDEMELEESRGRLAELTSLFQLGNSLHMEMPLETILEITVRRLASTLHSHDVALFLLDPEAKTLSWRAGYTLKPRDPEPEVTVGDGAVGWCASHREPILMQSTDREARFADFFGTHPDIGSVLILPVATESRTVAVLQVGRALKAERFRLEHRDIGELFAHNVAAVIDRARMMESLRRTAAQATGAATEARGSAASAFRDTFLTAASQELKSPLTSIVAYSEVLDQNDRKMTPAMRLEFTSRLRTEAQRLIALVDDVLEVARLELGRYLLELTVANVNDVVLGAVETARPQAESRGLSLEVALDRQIPDQHLDPGKLRQAIGNLLRNGLRFSPPKGRVRVSTWLRDDSVLIEVRDSGPVVPVDGAATLFDLESAASGSCGRCKDGLGFGLHLTRRYVELHGGEVDVEPDTGGAGASFRIRLPRGEDLTQVIGADPFVEELAKG